MNLEMMSAHPEVSERERMISVIGRIRMEMAYLGLVFAIEEMGDQSPAMA